MSRSCFSTTYRLKIEEALDALEGNLLPEGMESAAWTEVEGDQLEMSA
jgi:hypothetical protein